MSPTRFPRRIDGWTGLCLTGSPRSASSLALGRSTSGHGATTCPSKAAARPVRGFTSAGTISRRG